VIYKLTIYISIISKMWKLSLNNILAWVDKDLGRLNKIGNNLRSIIIFNHDQSLLEYYNSIIRGLYDDVTLINAQNDQLEQIKGNNVVIINYDNSHSAEPIIKYCLENSTKIPCIITGNSQEILSAKKKFKSHGLLDYFSHEENVEILWQKINRFTNLNQRSLQKKEYCKVNLSFFFSTKTVFCDIYLRMGEMKYVKIFNRYDKIDFKDIKKYDQRNIQYLYVRERDFSLIMKKLVKELRPLMDSDSQSLTIDNKSLSSTFSMQLQETVSESIQKIGLSGEAIEMTNLAINSTLDLIQKDLEIFQVLQDIIKGKNYISEHSFLLTYISCSLLKESPYSHPDNHLALSVAAFFHDIALDSEEKAKIQNLYEYQFKTLGIEDQEDVINHPQKASNLVSNIVGMPEVVQTILIQHHEQYDGTGFPSGIDYKRINPLSAIFSVAHELSIYLYDSGHNKENISDIVTELSKKYLRGNFKMAIEAAQKVFHTSDISSLEEEMEDPSLASSKKAV